MRPKASSIGIKALIDLKLVAPEKSKNPTTHNISKPPIFMSIAPNRTISDAPTPDQARTGIARLKLMVLDFTNPMQTNVAPEVVKVSKPSNSPPNALEKNPLDNLVATDCMRSPASACME